MKPPYSKGPGDRTPGGPKNPTGPKRTRHGGPRPATPRPPGARQDAPRDAHRIPRPAQPARNEHADHAAAEPRQPREGRPVLQHRAAAAPAPASGGFGREPRPRAPESARGGPESPRGTIWLYGQHAVASALANPQRRLRRLLLTEEAEAAMAAALRQLVPGGQWPIQPERAERARLDQLLGRDVVHQGAALLADPLSPPALAQALERPGPVLVLDQVTDPRNIGAILRAAAAFGAAAVITQERNAPEETGALAKAASGALEKVPLFRAVNIARTLVALKAAGCWVVGLDAGGGRLSGPALAQRRVALVLGSEGEGMRRLTRDTCDEVAGIGMPGGHASDMESLNVSTAAAIALYELTRPA
ncbi:MAG TPA: TrmH family RNA methyltransferase [Acetobacteraceae bacterium]